MKTLHIAPGQSAGGSLIRAIQDAGRDEEVLSFFDDLSCGPIQSDEPSARDAWWSQFGDTEAFAARYGEFWRRVTATNDRLILWFARRAAGELSFFLSWTDRLGERPYLIVDATGQRLESKAPDGSVKWFGPAQAVSHIPAYALRTLLGTERPITAAERNDGQQRWQQLRKENAPFRIVTEEGLVSTSIDYFDPLLLAQATHRWQKVALVVGKTMGDNSDPYHQVGDLMLLTRIVALVESGRLVAEGDPWSMHKCRVRLPD
jgi:hypothetical protein